MSKSSRRYYRTIFLGVAAMATLIWAAVEQFDIPLDVMMDLLLTAVLVTAVVIGLAALVTLSWLGLKKLAQRGRGDP